MESQGLCVWWWQRTVQNSAAHWWICTCHLLRWSEFGSFQKGPSCWLIALKGTKCKNILYFCVCSGRTHRASGCPHPCPQVWGQGEACGLPAWLEVTHRRSWVKCIPGFPAVCLSDSSLLSSFRSCGCSKSCISDLGGSVWFSKRYDPKQQPILRQKNNYFDPDALKWWLVRPKCRNNVTASVLIREGTKPWCNVLVWLSK